MLFCMFQVIRIATNLSPYTSRLPCLSHHFLSKPPCCTDVLLPQHGVLHHAPRRCTCVRPQGVLEQDAFIRGWQPGGRCDQAHVQDHCSGAGHYYGHGELFTPLTQPHTQLGNSGLCQGNELLCKLHQTDSRNECETCTNSAFTCDDELCFFSLITHCSLASGHEYRHRSHQALDRPPRQGVWRDPWFPGQQVLTSHQWHLWLIQKP